MNDSQSVVSSRREFLKTAGSAVAVSALAGVAIPHVHAAGGDSIQLALVGCGGRGTGAAGNALSTIKKGPASLAAMVVVFENRVVTSYETIKKVAGDLGDIPKAKRFNGFVGSKHA